MATVPGRTRIYQNHHLDSTRWDGFRPREDDIVIATSVKSGTTWMQAIVANLLYPRETFPAPPRTLSPWIDNRPAPLATMLAELEAQRHRRFVKTHLPLDGLPYFPEVKYIFVCRDGRDVALSLWNHYRNYTDEAFRRYNDTPGRVGDPLPTPPEHLETFWRNWCTRGSFAWEHDGWPFWSHLHATQSWWDYRHLPNIMLVHYADLKRDLLASVARVAAYLGIRLTAERLAEVVAASTFDNMRQRSAEYVPNAGASWKGGSATFMRKGANRQWDGTIPEEDLALYEAACARALSPDCRSWMDAGDMALTAG